MAGLLIEEPILTGYQDRILNSDARFSVVIASTKVGKTFMMIWWLFKLANSPQDKRGNHYFWLSPIADTSRMAYRNMKDIIAGANGFKTNEQLMSIECPNGSIIRFVSADNPHSLYGREAHGVVYDEFSRVDNKDAWNAIRSTMIYTQAPAKLIGNYVNRAWVNDMIALAENPDEPDYEFHRITAYDAVDAGILAAEEIERAKREYTKAEFDELFLGIAADNSAQLIQQESIEKIFVNELPTGTKYLTIDVARMGADRTIALVWDGLKVIDSLVI
ncbi:MAG TPA: hypothetical protein ENH60_05690, partial [Pricia sp.]|nr:hypothetical protein [Pricia sp.]